MKDLKDVMKRAEALKRELKGMGFDVEVKISIDLTEFSRARERRG